MAHTRPTVSGYLVVAAGKAGNAEGRAVRRALEVLAADAPTELRRTRDRTDLEAALDALDGRRLVLAGGDGSLNLVVSSLLARGEAHATPVGLVPLGTGNSLAQALGLPLDAADAAQRVVHGRARALDVLRRGEDVAVNAAHAGFGVGAARRARRWKPALGVLAYRLGAAWAGVAHHGVTATVEVDGRPLCRDEAALLVAVANGSFIGGGTPLCPAADPADGLLDVVVVTDRSRVQRAAFALALSRGRHAQLPGVSLAQGRRVDVQLGQQTWNVDGELTPAPAALTWRTEPAVWRIVA